jgi:hypothetical protein
VKPCDERCPAVTGEGSGALRFGPGGESARPRGCSEGATHQRRGVDGWETWDWRTRSWIPGQVEIPPHPDYTDCCADFRCCADKWAAAGMHSVRDTLVGAARAGGGAFPVLATDEGAHVVTRPPGDPGEEA